MRGYLMGRFSFNVKGGRCEACRGEGVIKVEMHFLPDVYVRCDVCGGKRYNRETLQISYRAKNISDCLEMTVTEALDFFDKIPPVREKLKTLYDVGLGYIKLGQPATTLSGGEAQRIKLARELGKRATGKTLYLLHKVRRPYNRPGARGRRRRREGRRGGHARGGGRYEGLVHGAVPEARIEKAAFKEDGKGGSN
jgi:excinuclease UvrABC ATPase subunit